MYKRITSSWQNRHLRFLTISQFLYEVMIISLLHENSTLYMDMDFCISSGMGWRRFLCYIWVITLHDSYLYIESYPYVLLLSFAEWFFSLILSDYLYLILICRRYHGLCFLLILVTMHMNCVIVYCRTLCKTVCGWRAILVKYVLIKKTVVIQSVCFITKTLHVLLVYKFPL